MGGEGEREKRIAQYAEALEWAMANVDDLGDDLVKRYVLYVKKLLEKRLREDSAPAGQRPLRAGE